MELCNRWTAACCLRLWYQFIVLMYAIRVSPVNLMTTHAMVSTTNPKQFPQVPFFLGCSLLFSQCCILLSVLVLQQHFCHHHLRLSQVLKLHRILIRFFKNAETNFISTIYIISPKLSVHVYCYFILCCFSHHTVSCQRPNKLCFRGMF